MTNLEYFSAGAGNSGQWMDPNCGLWDISTFGLFKNPDFS
jgi:hypothetical protein